LVIASKEQAYEYLQLAEKALLQYQDSAESYIGHCLNVAKAARLIAEQYQNLDDDTAEIFGLLHDIGKINYESICKRHHSVTGYEYMMGEGYSDIARICLTHTFPLKYFDEITEEFFFHNKVDIAFVLDFLNNNEMNKYDEIIQIADIISMPKGFATIDARFADIISRYNGKDMGKSIYAYKELKDKLSNEIGRDIYEILAIDVTI